MNILLVDDEIIIINILKETIDWRLIGIDNVFSAYNAHEAKKIIINNNIDLIICDIEMPQENGLQLLQWVQKQNPKILNIVLTGYPDFNYAQSAISIGVYKFILKPIVFEDLVKVVCEALDKIKTETVKEKYRKYGEYFVTQSDSVKSLEEQIDTMVDRFSISVQSNKQKQPAIDIVKNYLEQHYNEDISRKNIESLVHLNEDYLNREFKKATGYTLLEYIHHYRLTVAKSRLINSNASISEISMEIGYDSPPYFAKVFKKFTGVTPVEYRNKNRI